MNTRAQAGSGRFLRHGRPIFSVRRGPAACVNSDPGSNTSRLAYNDRGGIRETSMRNYLLRGALLTAALLLAAVPAIAQGYRSAPPPGERPCLRQGYIYDFQIVPGNRSLVVTDLA